MSSTKKRTRVERPSRARPDNAAAAESIVRQVVEEISGGRIRQLVREELAAHQPGTATQIVVGEHERVERLHARATADAAAQAPKQSPRIEEATRGAEILTKRLADVADRLEAYNETRLGPRGMPTAPSGEDPARLGQAGLLLDALSRSHLLVSRLERELDRLSEL